MSNILFYTPFNQRSRDTESLMLALRDKGHRVISLNQTTGLGFHDYLKLQGIEVYTKKFTNPGSAAYYIKHVAYLIFFCWSKRISIVYSHLESANLVAVLAQYFIRSKVFVIRHHADYFSLTKKDSLFSYRIIYRFAKKIIVVSRQAKDFMVKFEGIDPTKIIHINLGYNFALFQKPQAETRNRIKQEIDASLTLITVGRFISIKRTELSILLLKSLLEHGYNAKLILLGTGELEQDLRNLAEGLSVKSRVLFQGHVDNVLDYIAAADFLIHPSISESSCVVVKEAAVVNVPVIVCKGVGDFDDYIQPHSNGFLVAKDNFIEEGIKIIEDYSANPNKLEKVRNKLWEDISVIFSVEKTVETYHTLSK